jgi:hypothetical protein
MQQVERVHMSMVDIMSDLLVEDRFGSTTMSRMITEDEQRRDDRKHPAERMNSPVRLELDSQTTQEGMVTGGQRQPGPTRGRGSSDTRGKE